MKLLMTVVDGPDDFFAALERVHPLAHVKWDAGLIDGMPEGRVVAYDFGGALLRGRLGGIFVLGESPFTYELMPGLGPIEDAEDFYWRAVATQILPGDPERCSHVDVTATPVSDRYVVCVDCLFRVRVCGRCARRGAWLDGEAARAAAMEMGPPNWVCEPCESGQLSREGFVILDRWR